MKIAVVIPARFASTRFEGKPLAAINGKPMIQWVVEGARQAREVTEVVVATDDQRIMDTVAAFGGRALMTSDRNRSGTDRVAEAAEKIGLSLDDVVVNIQGDQPMIHPDCIDEVVNPFFKNPDLQMSTLAFAIKDEEEIINPKDVKLTFDNNGFALYFSRATIPFDRDGDCQFDIYKHLGVYAYTRRFLETFRKLPIGKLETIEKLEQLRALEHGFRIQVVVTEHDSPEVDLPEDIQRIERRMTQQLDFLQNRQGLFR